MDRASRMARFQQGKMVVPIPGYVALAFVAGLVVALLGAWLWDRPQNFYECMLHEMRGQPDEMKQIAGWVCQQVFEVPTEQAD